MARPCECNQQIINIRVCLTKRQRGLSGNLERSVLDIAEQPRLIFPSRNISSGCLWRKIVLWRIRHQRKDSFRQHGVKGTSPRLPFRVWCLCVFLYGLGIGARGGKPNRRGALTLMDSLPALPLPLPPSVKAIPHFSRGNLIQRRFALGPRYCRAETLDEKYEQFSHPIDR